MKNLINLKKILLSFKNAFAGLRIVFWEEQSFRVQLVVAILVVIATFVFELHYLAKVGIILAIAFVLGLEILNAQIERTLNLLHPGLHPEVKKIKDLAAAAVLVAAMGAVIVGLVVFIANWTGI